MSSSPYRHLFPRALLGGYLDTAAEGLPAPGMAEAFAEYLREKTSGTPGRKRHFEKEREARELVARLLAVRPADVTFVASASDALNILAASLNFHPGDEVIITDLEFPSNVLPWLALKARGVHVHVIPSRDGSLLLEHFASRINRRTRLVSVSLVSYKSGAYLRFTAELGRMVHEAGGVLCVDATQALGRSAVPVEGIDYLMASSFKWLTGPHGLAIVYVSPQFRDRFEPVGVGWYSVENVFSPDRFERYTLKAGAACVSAGMPNFGALYAMCEALRFILAVDRDRETQRLDALSLALRRDIASLEVEMLTPADPGLVSGIVAFEHPNADAVASTLAQEGLTVWGGDSRVRASLHCYNDESDLEAVVAALRRALQRVTHAS